MKDYIIRLQRPSLFWLGDHFYKVDESHKINGSIRETFSSTCPSCNNTRRIKYKGYDGNDYETSCPICSGRFNTYGTTITIRNWQVQNYIVHKINAQGPNTITAYKDGIGYIDSLSLSAFCKVGRCADDKIECNVPLLGRNVDKDIKEIDIENVVENFLVGDYVFRKKAMAEQFCLAIKEYDKKRLSDFNKTYHTNYKYPY